MKKLIVFTAIIFTAAFADRRRTDHQVFFYTNISVTNNTVDLLLDRGSIGEPVDLFLFNFNTNTNSAVGKVYVRLGSTTNHAIYLRAGQTITIPDLFIRDSLIYVGNASGVAVDFAILMTGTP